MTISIILENVRSAHNVGAVFRTADGAGVAQIYLVGYTPRPIDRFARVQPEIKKTSLGATHTVSWEYHEDSKQLIPELQTQRKLVVVVEQTPDALPYKEFELPHPKTDVVFVFGNEIEGVSAAAIAAADHVIHLPMSGQKESLNVATTTGIVLFHFKN